MAGEDEIKREVEDTVAADKAFENMAEENPEREVLPPEGGGGEGVTTLTRRSEVAPNLSDMQAAFAKLFPEDLGDEITNKFMIAGITPDAFMPLLRMMTVDEISMSDPTTPPDIPKILAKNYILLTKGLDRKGIIDFLEIVGAVREQEELKGLAGLGM